MQQLVTFLLMGLAVYRISRMIADEEGPFSVFQWLRKRFPPENWIGRGLECIMCVSFWVALPFAIVAGDLLWWPALSAVTVIIRRWEQKR